VFDTKSLRTLNLWIFAGAAVVLAGMAYWTYRVSADERNLYEDSSYRISESLVVAVETHLDETLRDARNAVYSAAILLERNSRPYDKMGTDWLHRELNRELSDHTSIARMVAADLQGRIIASSAESSVMPGTAISGESVRWHLSHGDSGEMHLGVTHASTVSGKLVVPYSRAILADGGRISGIVLAELDLDHFTRVYAKLIGNRSFAIRWIAEDGNRLMVFPYVPGLIGNPVGKDTPLEKMLIAGGRLEFESPASHRTYLFAYAPLDRFPVVIAVGQDKSEALALWVERTRARAISVALFAVLFIVLVAALRRNLRRLAASNERLEASEAQFRMLADNLPDAMIFQFTQDENGERRFLYVSAAINRLNGLSQEAVMRTSGLLHAQVIPEDQKLLRLGTGDSFQSLARFDAVVRLRRADGELRWMQFRAVPRATPGGAVMWDGIELDITERVRSEAEVRVLNQELEQRVEKRTMELSVANRNLEQFAYSVAHDLRAPLHRISGFAGLLRTRLDGVGGDGIAKLEVITREAQRMSEMIDALLALARTDRAALSMIDLDLEKIAKEIVEDSFRQFSDRNIKFEIGILPKVRGDEVLLRQVLTNLIANAVKFTRKEATARVEIGARLPDEPDGDVVVFVKDNGVGFEANYASKLFAVFQRLHSATEFEGTGIGLALVQRIVERHGGKVWATSDEGKGAVFYFSLPILKSEIPDSTSAAVLGH
jgi:PAS domain S-box-containing protein